MTADSIFQVGAPGVDVEAIVRDIQAAVEKKIADGVYDDARIARADRLNIAGLKGQEQFLGFYLRCLREAVFVDISDFEIRERRRGLGPLLVALKKTIWKLLNCYTYRLWSQQNQVNGLVITAIEGLDEQYGNRIKALEARVAELEKMGKR
jgi:hypothetical protein